MNIDDAAKVFREHKYRGTKNWRAVHNRYGLRAFVPADNPQEYSDVFFVVGFEAIAIAEKLERDAGRNREALSLDAVMPLLEAIAERAAGPNDKGLAADYLADLHSDPTTLGDVYAVVEAWKARRA